MLDGAKGLKEKLEPLFPNAIITLDVCHVVEKLWELGHRFHKEGSEELKAWGRGIERAGLPRTCRDAGETVTDVAEASARCTAREPRDDWQALKKLIGYLKPRLKMMQYRKWISEDLVIASGQVEGAVRHVVGERMDLLRHALGYLNVPELLLHLCLQSS